ncbi:MAG: acyl-ACP--UDP-N-acetylglucosamine O-acyltransferase [Candidatus Nucleicultricaceae bacterium]
MSTKPLIHPTAVIEPSVKLGLNVHVGPFCHLSGNVEIADDVTLHSHVVVAGHTKIGKGTEIFPFASIGHRPQDLKYHGEASTLTIGEYNMIREYVTIQPGTEGGGMKTVVGNRCLIMANAHIAHDCIIGNHVIMANSAALGGHVSVEDYAIIGGLAAVHQFVRIGTHAIIGGMSGVEHDVLPYAAIKGERASLYGLNLIGLRRRGATKEDIYSLKNAYDHIFQNDGTLADRVETLSHQVHNDRVNEIIAFIQKDSKKKLCSPKEVLDDAFLQTL